MKQGAALETQRAEKNQAITAMTSAMGREEGAKSQLADLRAQHLAEISYESKEMDSVIKARKAMRVARDKAISEATTTAEEKCQHLLEIEAEKIALASANNELSAKLSDRDEQLRVAGAEVERMKAETAKRMVDCKHLEASSERYNITSGVEAAETHCIDLDYVSDLSPVLLDIRHSFKHTHWAGWEDEGHSTSRLGPAFVRLLDLRKR